MVEIKLFIHNKFPKAAKVSYHFHNYYEFVYYFHAAGQSKYFPANFVNTPSEARPTVFYNKSVLNDPDVFRFSDMSYTILPPYMVHDEEHEREDADVVAIVFSVEGEPQLRFPPLLKLDAGYKILPLVQRMLKEYQRKDLYYEQVLADIMHEILILVARDDGSGSATTSPMHFAKTYLDEYFMTDVDLENLARSSGYSLSHFRLLFKKFTGVSPKSYVLEKRLGYASNLIRNTALSLSVISETCGFHYYTQFYSLFEKRFGVSPKELRRGSGESELPEGTAFPKDGETE